MSRIRNHNYRRGVPRGPWIAFVLAISAMLTVLMAQSADAAPQSNAKDKDAKKTTEVSFEDVLVQGKYHFSDEAVTTVEEDKVLDSLLGVRKDFKDRIKKSVSRQ